jgi:hypothetical protein
MDNNVELDNFRFSFDGAPNGGVALNLDTVVRCNGNINNPNYYGQGIVVHQACAVVSIYSVTSLQRYRVKPYEIAMFERTFIDGWELTDLTAANRATGSNFSNNQIEIPTDGSIGYYKGKNFSVRNDKTGFTIDIKGGDIAQQTPFIAGDLILMEGYIWVQFSRKLYPKRTK